MRFWSKFISVILTGKVLFAIFIVTVDVFDGFVFNLEVEFDFLLLEDVLYKEDFFGI